MSNQILTIAPYRQHGTWVFDDDAADLHQEPFVAGAPEMIDVLVADIPQAAAGFRLLFSPEPFPGHQQVLIHDGEEDGGNWYRTQQPAMRGWLCPALFKYFRMAPQRIYVKAEALAQHQGNNRHE